MIWLRCPSTVIVTKESSLETPRKSSDWLVEQSLHPRASLPQALTCSSAFSRFRMIRGNFSHLPSLFRRSDGREHHRLSCARSFQSLCSIAVLFPSGPIAILDSPNSHIR
ncbi:uncharacterized protein LY89DRAFT_479862 [Mollisia scopiformis]|uniref:Uncharacterized protein n=1 Tax=Mollisia scopiformis TaxID=149040 RepID=A0A194XGD9_MOLSC|nr:uncharacterized protein LY89DRAFT_479862 [Mollisia scopiformis]KUJ19204.1 hypothetical protein LY89DRAFT_479862 [Mollisia scopiformis]